MKRFCKKEIPLVLILLFMASNVAADEHKFGEKRQQMIKELNLTPEQQEKMQSFKEQRQKMRSEKEKVKNDRDRLKVLLKDPNSSDAEIQKLADELTTRMSELMRQRIKGVLELRKTLKPEQFAKLMEKMEKRKEQFKEKRGFGFGQRGEGKKEEGHAPDEDLL